jgi:hypothetical protein
MNLRNYFDILYCDYDRFEWVDEVDEEKDFKDSKFNL